MARCGPNCEVCGLVPLIRGLRGTQTVVAESPAMRLLLRRVAKFAKSEAPVAICGETGTGKEVVARLIHANSSRCERPFIAVNVAALPPDLLESELFGHSRGAFTGATTQRQGLFEAAHGGTLFLDEIGEMAPMLQAKLLRVLQDGEVRRIGESAAFAVDVRIVCATHRDLDAAVTEGRFREDLLFRLKVLTLHMPPLRARTEDIAALAARFLSSERPTAHFSPAALAALTTYRWPGNVRELSNAVRFAAALSDAAQLDLNDLPDEVTRGAAQTLREALVDAPTYVPPSAEESAAPAFNSPLVSLAEAERLHILSVLKACKGAHAEAAAILRIGRNTLWRKLKRYQDTAMP